MLSEHKISIIVPPPALSVLAALGQVVRLSPNESLYEIEDRTEAVYLTLEGELLASAGDDSPPTWIGPGDIAGELGFVMGLRRTETMKAGGRGCSLLRIPSLLLHGCKDHEHRFALTHLLVALAPHFMAKLQNFELEQSEAFIENFCDQDHPLILRCAARLRRKNKWETAIAIWEFVRAMPYRFGHWNLTASQTLLLGYGMCTTKANLQAALLRACGIRAGFAELKINSLCVSLLLPRGYRSTINREIKHYFAAAYLDDRWYPCDASFSPASMPLVVEAIPEFEPYARMAFRRRSPYNIVGVVAGLGPFGFEAQPDLTRVMRKKPFYGSHNFDAMNVLLDKAQGPIHNLPGWAREARKLAVRSSLEAFHCAYAGISGEALRLYAAVYQDVSIEFQERDSREFSHRELDALV